MLALLEAGTDYRIANDTGCDLILLLENELKTNKDSWVPDWAATDSQRVFNWLRMEGVNWEAARTALKDQELLKRLQGPARRLPASSLAPPSTPRWRSPMPNRKSHRPM